MKKNDLLLLFAVLLVCVSVLLIVYSMFFGRGDMVLVTVDGKETIRLSLREDTEIVIEGYQGGTNTLVIQDGRVYVKDASCPDLVCVHTGDANELKSIVCAPNRVVISLESQS